MTYWGMAMANLMNVKRMKKFVEQAEQRRNQATPREQLYIDSLSSQNALNELLRQYPDEIEAHAFLGILPYVRAQRDGHRAPECRTGRCPFKRSLASRPTSPRAIIMSFTFGIHSTPIVRLDSAAKCGQSAPGIAHMWHMSGHLYSLINRYREGTWFMDASIRIDHRHFLDDRLMPDQISFYTHNAEWLVRNLVAVGRMQESIERAKDLVELPRHPAFNNFEREDSSRYGRDHLFDILTRYEPMGNNHRPLPDWFS